MSSAALLTACSKHYLPSKTGEVKFENLHAYSDVSMVALINVQPKNKNVKIGYLGNIGSPYANYNAWTNIAIHHTKKALKRTGIQVTHSGNKVLQLAVVKARVTDGEYIGMIPVIRPACQIVLKVSTAQGYEQSYDVTGKTFYAGWKTSCDEAMLEVVEELLKDNKIVTYLNN